MLKLPRTPVTVPIPTAHLELLRARAAELGVPYGDIVRIGIARVLGLDPEDSRIPVDKRQLGLRIIIAPPIGAMVNPPELDHRLRCSGCGTPRDTLDPPAQPCCSAAEAAAYWTRNTTRNTTP